MAIKVQIPGPLRPLTGGATEVEVEATNVSGLIEALEARHGGFRERLLDVQYGRIEDTHGWLTRLV